MIVSKIHGGLGNQLFQWSIVQALSEKNNCKYKFDISFYFQNQNYFTPSLRKFELHSFKNIKINILNDEDLINKKILKINEENIKNYEIEIKSDHINFLDGYWQNENYFKDKEESIRNILKIPDNLKDYLYAKYPILHQKQTVSLHVRRTDYLNLSHYHYNQDIEYYNKAFNYLNNKNINVLIFSDDIEWCKNNLKFKNTYYIEGEEDKTDLYMMSLCTHNIIANSTFSWWGAWLNNNYNKIVIAPDKWFAASGPKHIKTTLDNWVKL
jgi:hypothetical protein